ncbi:43kDa postsynaptic protein [Parasponia andersonii]|uniref:43kDa postsynaptic protein n=1 Tax=Parasponia andersonii TaxID=3476 RepID=A0A2P5DIX9_PARAD|nr:43kDa postsynaptic protein [Parasponia andersonii]
MADDNDQATKQPNNNPGQRIPFTRGRQAESDLALAMASQGQERSSPAAPFTTTLETIESGTDFDQEDREANNTNSASITSEDSSTYDYNQEDYEFFFEAELGFLDDQEDEDMEEYNDDDDDDDDDDELDVDELTYEELIALGEFIGVEERGLSPIEISLCLNPIIFSSKSPLNHDHEIINKSSPGGIDRCVICQIEYEDGESLVALPCEHPYHSECISKWLRIKKCCPICSSEVSSSSHPNNKSINAKNGC